MNDLVPEGWSKLKLGDLSDLVTKGTTPKSYCSTGINFVKVESVSASSTLIPSKFAHIDLETHASLKRSQLKAGDILFSIAGSLGRLSLIQKKHLPANTNQALAIIRLSKDSINPLFCTQQLKGEVIQTELKKLQTVGAQPNLSLQQVSDILLVTPPLPEQQKIAAILSSVDEVIEKTQAQINKLKDLKTGMMQELLSPREGQEANINNPQGGSKNGLHHTEFKDSPLGRIPVGWEVVKTGDISKSIVPGRNKPKSLSGDIPWLTIADLDSFYVDKSKKNLGVTYENLREANGKTIPAKSVIMSVVGEFGISSVARCEMVINQQLHGFVCNEDIDPAFLCLSLRHHKLQQERLATQTTIAYMNKDNAESILFAKPPFSQQLKIAASILAVDEKINVLNSKHSSYINTKKALMQDLLTGKVRVNVD